MLVSNRFEGIVSKNKGSIIHQSTGMMPVIETIDSVSSKKIARLDVFFAKIQMYMGDVSLKILVKWSSVA